MADIRDLVQRTWADQAAAAPSEPRYASESDAYDDIHIMRAILGLDNPRGWRDTVSDMGASQYTMTPYSDYSNRYGALPGGPPSRPEVPMRRPSMQTLNRPPTSYEGGPDRFVTPRRDMARPARAVRQATIGAPMDDLEYGRSYYQRRIPVDQDRNYRPQSIYGVGRTNDGRAPYRMVMDRPMTPPSRPYNYNYDSESYYAGRPQPPAERMRPRMRPNTRGRRAPAQQRSMRRGRDRG